MADQQDRPFAESSSISSTLLEQVRARQPQAWERMVRLYSPLVYRWCRRSGVSAEDSADLVQDVFTAVMLHLADFRRDGPSDSFTGWLATITRNKVRDHYRRCRHRPQARGGTTAQRALAEVPETASPDDPPVAADAASAALLTRRLMEITQAEFERRTWQAFEQTALAGRRAADVAQDLDMSVPAVYMAKSRVLRRLRETLSDLEPP
jgi:RNA polymerase sigma-70 factor, ECF subfamily